MMDSSIRSWFDDGLVSDALVGDGQYYVHAPAFDVHDRLYLVEELMKWAAEDPARKAISTAGFMAALDRLLAMERPDEAIDLLVAYAVAADGGKDRLPIPLAQVALALGRAQRLYEGAGEWPSRSVAVGELRDNLGLD